MVTVEIWRTDRFARWLDQLRDVRARDRILARIRRLSLGNPGDVRPVGGGVSELRIDHGPGYRVYFATHGSRRIILVGGTKQSQDRDIVIATELARTTKVEEFE